MLKSFFHTGFVVKRHRRIRPVLLRGPWHAHRRPHRAAGRVRGAGAGLPRTPTSRAASWTWERGHQLELIQYLSPRSGPGGINRNDLGACPPGLLCRRPGHVSTAETCEKGLAIQQPAGLHVRRKRQPFPQGLLRHATPTATGWSSSDCSKRVHSALNEQSPPPQEEG